MPIEFAVLLIFAFTSRQPCLFKHTCANLTRCRGRGGQSGRWETMRGGLVEFICQLALGRWARRKRRKKVSRRRELYSFRFFRFFISCYRGPRSRRKFVRSLPTITIIELKKHEFIIWYLPGDVVVSLLVFDEILSLPPIAVVHAFVFCSSNQRRPHWPHVPAIFLSVGATLRSVRKYTLTYVHTSTENRYHELDATFVDRKIVVFVLRHIHVLGRHGSRAKIWGRSQQKLYYNTNYNIDFILNLLCIYNILNNKI